MLKLVFEVEQIHLLAEVVATKAKAIQTTKKVFMFPVSCSSQETIECKEDDPSLYTLSLVKLHHVRLSTWSSMLMETNISVQHDVTQ